MDYIRISEVKEDTDKNVVLYIFLIDINSDSVLFKYENSVIMETAKVLVNSSDNYKTIIRNTLHKSLNIEPEFIHLYEYKWFPETMYEEFGNPYISLNDAVVTGVKEDDDNIIISVGVAIDKKKITSIKECDYRWCHYDKVHEVFSESELPKDEMLIEAWRCFKQYMRVINNPSCTPWF